MHKNRKLEYIQSALLGIIALKKLKNENDIIYVSSEDIQDLSKSILFEWEGIGNKEGDMEELIKWNLDQHICHSSEGMFTA